MLLPGHLLYWHGCWSLGSGEQAFLSLWFLIRRLDWCESWGFCPRSFLSENNSLLSTPTVGLNQHLTLSAIKGKVFLLFSHLFILFQRLSASHSLIPLFSSPYLFPYIFMESIFGSFWTYPQGGFSCSHYLYECLVWRLYLARTPFGSAKGHGCVETHEFLSKLVSAFHLDLEMNLSYYFVSSLPKGVLPSLSGCGMDCDRFSVTLLPLERLILILRSWMSHIRLHWLIVSPSPDGSGRPSSKFGSQGLVSTFSCQGAPH